PVPTALLPASTPASSGSTAGSCATCAPRSAAWATPAWAAKAAWRRCVPIPNPPTLPSSWEPDAVKRTSALDLLGATRPLGYSLAVVVGAIVVLLYLSEPLLGMSRPFVSTLAGPILLGLVVAWVTSLARVLVRRMRFASPQD